MARSKRFISFLYCISSQKTLFNNWTFWLLYRSLHQEWSLSRWLPVWMYCKPVCMYRKMYRTFGKKFTLVNQDWSSGIVSGHDTGNTRSLYSYLYDSTWVRLVFIALSILVSFYPATTRDIFWWLCYENTNGITLLVIVHTFLSAWLCRIDLVWINVICLVHLC